MIIDTSTKSFFFSSEQLKGQTIFYICCPQVWCVSRHDDVSAYARNIDRTLSGLSGHPAIALAAAGTKRQSVSRKPAQRSDASVSLMPTAGNESDGLESVVMLTDAYPLLDPVSDAPLKLSVASATELPQLALEGRRLRPRLTSVQKAIDSQQGTVLLLGRAGTGKTVCLCERMVEDRERAADRGALRQLFVSRSARLCALVRDIQARQCGEAALATADFLTLDAFLARLQRSLVEDRSCRTYPASCRVDFELFKRMLPGLRSVKRGTTLLDEHVLWMQIRSFIKGSLEAAMAGRPLTLREYLELVPNRCRLAEEQRREAYAVFEKYEGILIREGLWDDAVRVMDSVGHWLRDGLAASAVASQVQYDRVYVDEVQDCTQAEVTLFFLAACGKTQALFLAGDPAQAVAEGVDFRFEEVRSIVHALSDGREKLVRPVRLAVNYRSHSGILACASAVLSRMFELFPGSANEFRSDCGHFNGPKPSLWLGGDLPDGATSLRRVLSRNRRYVIICLDEAVHALTALFPDHLVFGIREAKGLEFPHVAIVNFFSTLPFHDQTVWRRLLRDNDGSVAASEAAAACPHAEQQLKLLYTAVTRSCKTLIFAETSDSPAGSAFFQWLQNKGLAEPLMQRAEETDFAGDFAGDVQEDNEEGLRAQGLALAALAESEDSREKQIRFLEQALKLFSIAGSVHAGGML